jgi:hypothetical protein
MARGFLALQAAGIYVAKVSVPDSGARLFADSDAWCAPTSLTSAFGGSMGAFCLSLPSNWHEDENYRRLRAVGPDGFLVGQRGCHETSD